MKFTCIPDHFAPALLPLVYEIETEDKDSAVDVEVSDPSVRNTLGIKRFAPTDMLSANVAGYVRRRLDPNPSAKRGFRFIADPGRSAAINVKATSRKAASAAALSRVFICATRQACDFDLLSMLPPLRTLSQGERDEISIAVPETILTAELKTTASNPDIIEGKSITLTAGEFRAERGVATLVVDSTDIVREARNNGLSYADCGCADVVISADGNPIAKVTYELGIRSSSSQRLCWLNSMGGIDYHTFHLLGRKSVAVSKQRIFSESGYHTASLSATETTELVSGYCVPPLSDALMEIICSRKVWMVMDRTFVPVNVVTDRVDVGGDSLFSLRLTLRTIRNF